MNKQPSHEALTAAFRFMLQTAVPRRIAEMERQRKEKEKNAFNPDESRDNDA